MSGATRSSVNALLRNPFYSGQFWYKGEIITENVHHEALITPSHFQSVQQILNTATFRKQQLVFYAYSGALFCGECGNQLGSPRQKGLHYYHCTRKRTSCTKASVTSNQRKYYREEWLEDKIHQKLSQIRIPKAILDYMLQQLETLQAKGWHEAEQQIKGHEATLQRAKQKLNNLFALKIAPENSEDSLITPEEYKTQRAQLKAEIQDLEQQILHIQCTDTSWLEECRKLFDFTVELPQTFAETDPEEKRSLIQNLGEVHVQNSAIEYKLHEPYSILEEFREILPQKPVSSEPRNLAAGSAETAFSGGGRTIRWTFLLKLRNYFAN